MAEYSSPVRPDERGAALLTVLLLVAVMAVIAATALERLTIATRLEANAVAGDQARAYAESVRELAAVKIDALIAQQSAETPYMPAFLGRAEALPLPEGTGSLIVRDGGNCFNLNSVVVRVSDDDIFARPLGVQQFGTLMRLLGIEAGVAQRIAVSLSDWIDSDSAPQPGGAEDDSYLQRSVPYRASNRLLQHVSELRAVAGVTPRIYQTLRPWICALPEADLSRLNVNSLMPGQAVLLAMLFDGKMTAATAQQVLARRPTAGFDSTIAFWAMPSLADLASETDVTQQVVLTTKWYEAELRVDLGRQSIRQIALYDGRENPIKLISNIEGEDE